MATEAPPGNGQQLPETVFVFLNNGNGTFTQSGKFLSGLSAPLVAVADVNLDGNPDIVAADTSGVFLLSGKGDGTFAKESVILTSGDVSQIAIADMNGDGIPDLVLVHATAQTISVLPGNGDGTFGPSTDTPVPLTVSAIAVGDFNGDGIPDVVYGSRSAYAVTVMLGAGNGGFSTAVSYPSGDAVGIIVADKNGDGVTDLITGNYNDNSITVLAGNGDGKFRPPFRDALGINNNGEPGVWSPFVGDFNGDGIPDILNAGGNIGGYGGRIYLFPGHGDGTFGQPIAFGTFIGKSVVADFNGDGIMDLAIPGDCCDNAGSSISFTYGVLAPQLTLTVSANPVLAGQPLTLTATANYTAATGIVTITGMDPVLFSGTTPIGVATLVNGTASLTIPNPTAPGTVYYAAYSGDATYSPTLSAPIQVTVVKPGPGMTLTTSPNPAVPGQSIKLTATLSQSEPGATIAFYYGVTLLASATVSSTQATLTTTLFAGTHQITAVFQDVEVSSVSATVTEHVTPIAGGQLVPGPSYYLTGLYGLPVTDPTNIISADFNRDGFPDLAVLSPAGKSFVTFLGNGLGYFDNPSATPFTFVPGAAVAGPFTPYGYAGLAVTDPADNAVAILPYYSPGSGFLLNQTLSTGTQPAAIATADFNGDGNADLITANAGSNDVSVLLTVTYGGSFATAVELGAGTYPDAIVTGDFNGDGRADFAVANRDSNNVMFFAGNGDGTFRSPTVVTNVNSPTVMITADVNGDGKQDLVAANASPGQITVLLGNGDGTFRNPIFFNAAKGLTSMLATDLAGTGIPSLVVTTGSGLMVYTGNGDGTFQPPVNYAQYAGAGSVSAAPYSNDGRMDLAVAMPATNSVVFIYNDAPTTLSLSLSSSTVPEGSTVTLNVSVPPAGSSGWVDCFDGVIQAGTGLVKGGKATITTTALLPGTHKLSCEFIGASGFGPSVSSSTVTLVVSGVASVGLGDAFVLAFSPSNSPADLVSGDFYGDGIPDFLYDRGGGGLIALGSTAGRAIPNTIPDSWVAWVRLRPTLTMTAYSMSRPWCREER